jgi:hypothetical protein
LEIFLIGHLVVLDGNGDGEGQALLQFGADSWASIAAEQDIDLDSFVSFDLAFLASRNLSFSAPSFSTSLCYALLRHVPLYEFH